jgi:hypothetical protein
MTYNPGIGYVGVKPKTSITTLDERRVGEASPLLDASEADVLPLE